MKFYSITTCERFVKGPKGLEYIGYDRYESVVERRGPLFRTMESAIRWISKDLGCGGEFDVYFVSLPAVFGTEMVLNAICSMTGEIIDVRIHEEEVYEE